MDLYFKYCFDIITILFCFVGTIFNMNAPRTPTERETLSDLTNQSYTQNGINGSILQMVPYCNPELI